ncbi:hypothetical protein JMJ77_0001090, partial [Colletotrichum scovillei]
ERREGGRQPCTHLPWAQPSPAQSASQPGRPDTPVAPQSRTQTRSLMDGWMDGTSRLLRGRFPGEGLGRATYPYPSVNINLPGSDLR